jgi:hypothetical protein
MGNLGHSSEGIQEILVGFKAEKRGSVNGRANGAVVVSAIIAQILYFGFWCRHEMSSNGIGLPEPPHQARKSCEPRLDLIDGRSWWHSIA